MSDESIASRIRKDVESILIQTGKRPRLVYLVSQGDADAMVPGDLAAPARFEMNTCGGPVGIAVDRWCPAGSVHRAYECACGALFVDDRSRSGKCATCMMTSVAETICDLRATASHRCARCSATLDETSVEGHGERCFRPGDWVRANLCDGEFVDGPIATLRNRSGLAEIRPEYTSPSKRHYIDKGSFTLYPGDRNIRRIPDPAPRVAYDRAVPGSDKERGIAFSDASTTRPAQSPCPPEPVAEMGITLHCQGQAADGKQCRETTTEPQGSLCWRCPAHADPLEMTHDGVTLRALLDGDEFNRRELGRARWNAKAMTPAQRAAVSAHWSAQLRARIDAARERERVRVQIDADPDDTPW